MEGCLRYLVVWFREERLLGLLGFSHLGSLQLETKILQSGVGFFISTCK
jgi:hypothetical protein